MKQFQNWNKAPDPLRKIENLLLMSRKDPSSFFFQEDFPLDLFKFIFKQSCIIPPSNISLLYGPPGCGKTFLVRDLFSCLPENVKILSISIPEVVSKYFTERSNEDLEQIFQYLKKTNDRCFLFFDEIESISDMTLEILCKNLIELPTNVFILISSLRPWSISPNLLNIFHQFNYLPVPESNDRIEFFRYNFPNINFEKEHEKISSKTEFCSIADLTQIYTEINMAPVRRIFSSQFFKKNPKNGKFTPCLENENDSIQLNWDLLEENDLDFEEMVKDSFCQHFECVFHLSLTKKDIEEFEKFEREIAKRGKKFIKV